MTTTTIDPHYTTSLLTKPEVTTVLAVDDNGLSLAFLETHVTQLGHAVRTANNGQEAISILRANYNHIDAILMDREMPVMDGLTAVRLIKEDATLRNIPIIMVTGADSNDDVQAGLQAGVFYYITKPVNEQILASVLAAAIREKQQSRILQRELGQHKTSFHLIDTCKFSFQTLSQAESLAAFMANCFPVPNRVLSGLGALLINAIEHGNLDIGYQEKGVLVDTGTWRQELERRQELPQYSNKIATATIARKEHGIIAIINDEGGGFDWKKYLRIDPARANDNHGRGIAQANALSFDKLVYNDLGTQAIALVHHQPQLDW